jgi:hypothetical protein
MTLEEFLAAPYPTNAFIDREGWDTLYVRKAPIGVKINGKVHRVNKVFTFANIGVDEPGQGLFTKLVEELVAQGWAIYVECVHDLNPRFQDGLRRRGYLELREEGGRSSNFLFNYEGHTHEWVYHGGI